MSRYSIAFYLESIAFSPDVIAGTASLGGSESACLGLARALAARGHDVHAYAQQLEPSYDGVQDHAGLTWHHADDLRDTARFIEWDVFVALRMPAVFGLNIPARLRLLWNQDLLIGEAGKNLVMGVAWAIDRFVYVSEFHRTQWDEYLPEITGHGWVTKNGYDPALVPSGAVKDPHRIIHISRPERGLGPILAMWPELRKQRPDAELHLCRYNSMYDAGGWGKVCASYDAQVQAVNEAVGGITYLGELGKAALYQAIAESAVMWYPGIPDFAETSCIAAIEAQACGTPFVGSWKGALPETVPSGVLIDGDAWTPEYQSRSIEAVVKALDGCARQAFDYRRQQVAGRKHVEAYSYAAIAGEWEAFMEDTFRTRYHAQKRQVLNRLLHYDDHTAALTVARELGDTEAVALCERVIRGEDQGSEDYAERALDPLAEIKANSLRMQAVLPYFKDTAHLLDVACGNGAFALRLAQEYPHLKVTGVDYAAANIAAATAAAAQLGLSDRVRFVCGSPWDLVTQTPQPLPVSILDAEYDGLFIGEFLEHVADAPGLIDYLDTLVADNATVLYTMPYGPWSELLERDAPYKRGHVHHFCHDDLTHIFGSKANVLVTYLQLGVGPRGAEMGHWLVSYLTAPDRPARGRDYAHRIVTTRPWSNLTVGLITRNSELDLAKCLQSVFGIADEIVIGDTGSDDDTKAVAEKFASRKLRWMDLPPVEAHHEGFAGARNAVLSAATGEWFFWIDSDEELLRWMEIGKYLDSGGAFNGFALRQQHLMLDAPSHYDTPVRLFRRSAPIQFYGCVHEQPQMGDCNGDVVPALEITDATLCHVGYRTESLRKQKMLSRNLALLTKDQIVFPDRRLGKVLWVREYINLAEHEMRTNCGNVTPKVQKYLAQCIGLFEKYFLSDPSDKYHQLARGWYETALKHTASARLVPMPKIEKPDAAEHIRVRSLEDAQRTLAYRWQRITENATNKPPRFDPITPAPTPAREMVA